MWRESLEAALVVGILLTYLARSGERAGMRYVWAGALGAVVAATAMGAVCNAAGGRPPPRGGKQGDGRGLPLAEEAGGLDHGLALPRRQPARRAARRARRVPLPSLAPRGARLRDLPARHGLGAAPCRRGGAGRGR